MVLIEGDEQHLSRCKRFQNIDWSKPAVASNLNFEVRTWGCDPKD